MREFKKLDSVPGYLAPEFMPGTQDLAARHFILCQVLRFEKLMGHLTHGGNGDCSLFFSFEHNLSWESTRK